MPSEGNRCIKRSRFMPLPTRKSGLLPYLPSARTVGPRGNGSSVSCLLNTSRTVSMLSARTRSASEGVLWGSHTGRDS
jgi:hypothetical protein